MTPALVCNIWAWRELVRGHAYGGITDADGHEVACPEELDVFRLLGWGYMPPESRV